jgi:DNA-binding Xre family transcriptional regulator
MITFFVKELLISRGYKYPNNTLRKLGFHYQQANQLLSGKARSLNLHQLEILCTFLNCTPNDILNFTPDAKDYMQARHPLNDLKKETDGMGPIDYLRSLSPGELKMANQILKQLHDKKAVS